jgi:hypothetical protein
MPSDLAPVRFSVVKYVSDPVRDEPINIGVVGITDKGIDYRFPDTLSRFKSSLETDDLKDLAVAIKFLRSSLDRTPNKSLEELQALHYGRIRLSELLGGLSENPQGFLDDQYELYVSSLTISNKARSGEDRTKVKERIRKAIGGKGRQSEQFALGRRRVKGKLGQFPFDFGIVNGNTTLLHAISFQTHEDYALNEAKILTWAALDTRAAHDDVQIAAVVAPPVEQTATYEEARRVLESQTEVLEANNGELDAFLESILNDPNVRPVSQDWLEVTVRS